jgi:opacity protein-like surface antigen
MPALLAGAEEAANPHAESRNAGTPKVELFLGYSYVRATPTLAAGNRLVWLNGGSTSVAYNFNRHLGLVGDFGAYTNSEIRFAGAFAGTVPVDTSNVAVLTYLAGPRFSFRSHERFTPYAQALFGGVHANQVVLSDCASACMLLPSETTFALTAGGGLDFNLRRHLAIRIVQAEYLMTRFTDHTTGNSGMQNDIRLSSGIVFRFGGNPKPPPPPPSPLGYSCSVSPASAFPAEPIAASGMAVNLNLAKTPVYTWQADAGAVTGTSSTARIDTTGVAPGTYTLKGHVSQGDRPDENADCSAAFAVKAFDPPTVSCSASPTSVISGNPANITAVAVSPQNRPLTYSYSATSGSVNGSGSTATLSTVGATLGTVGVTCTVLDDKGQSASAPTSVTVAAPVTAAAPRTSDLCSVRFERDLKRPVRVDNEAKACLDEIALSLNSSPDARLALVGNAPSEQKDGTKLAAERAVNTKAYLVSEKGIDASRIGVYTRAQDGKAVSSTLIPAGATLDSSGDTPVDESAVGARPARHKSK